MAEKIMTKNSNSKVALIGDLHFGAKSDAEFMKKYQSEVLEYFLQDCVEKGVDTIISPGDVFDRRRVTNTETFRFARETLFNRVYELGLNLILTIGNHDTYYKSTNFPNTLTEYVKGVYSNVYVYDDIDTFQHGNTEFLIVPWINPENHDEYVSYMKNSNANVCVGHFEINGFRMMQGGIQCDDGLNQNFFKGFDRVFSGHFHHPSSKGKIQYLGSPYELYWGDEGDAKGYAIYDTETNKFESWVEFPHFLHRKLFYNDDVESSEAENPITWDGLSELDFQYLSGKKVKIIVEEKQDHNLFDEFIRLFDSVDLLEFSIQEKVEGYSNLTFDVDEAEGTLTTIEKSVKMISDNRIDQDRLFQKTQEVYYEALDLESNN